MHINKRMPTGLSDLLWEISMTRHLLHTCTLTHTAWGASRRSWRCHEVADTAGVLDTGSEGTTGQGGKEGESPFM